METKNLLWDSLQNTGVFLEDKICISIQIRLIFSPPLFLSSKLLPLLEQQQ